MKIVISSLVLVVSVVLASAGKSGVKSDYHFVVKMGKNWDDSGYRQPEMHIVLHPEQATKKTIFNIRKEKEFDLKISSLNRYAGQIFESDATIDGHYFRLQDIAKAEFYWKHKTDKRVIRIEKITAIYEQMALSFCPEKPGQDIYEGNRIPLQFCKTKQQQ